MKIIQHLPSQLVLIALHLESSCCRCIPRSGALALVKP